MEKKHELSMEEMDRVSGGGGNDTPEPKFSVGEAVFLRNYLQYGVGIVQECTLNSGGWNYTVKFDAGMITEPESEFIPA